MALLACLLYLASYVAALPVYPAQSPILLDHTQGYKFDPLLHLPGISPYFDAVGFGLEHAAPPGCTVTAASYLVRHAAIYANDDEYEEYIKPFLWKLEKHRQGWSGPLEFMSTWVSPILEDHLEDITPSGAEDAQKVGSHLVKRYPTLAPTVKKILADKKPRTFDTAVALSKAFPNHKDIEVVQFLHNHNGSFDSLIPHKSCSAFSKAPGTKEMATFVHHYAPHVSGRLARFTPFELSDNDVVGLQSLCGYESAIKGEQSPICAVILTSSGDLKYSHMVGPLNPLSPYLGFPWLKTQSELFQQLNGEPNSGSATDTGSGWPSSQRFFLSFTHREVPPFVATALGIFNSSSSAMEEFPTDHINWARSWRMSDLIPFLGHVGMEKMTCDGRPGREGEYIRVIANTAPRPIPSCQDGPGASCSMEQWTDIIAQGAEKYKDYDEICSNTS
ncbi:histidine acid phosphatase [Cladophialophora carrionii]|uniref:Histidine acid phosphatase n=1 Tax=Cladophialophora carrionii TaxID=86049 RepID=A0A1C1CQR0_9EURO|nr:histidine acid phosphatase [Cladophialophora carrionii]